MIIGGIIAVIAGVIAILGVSALAALAGSAEGIGLLYASSILVTITSVIEIIAGEFNITSPVLNLVVPGLYVYGALKTKPNVNA